MLQVEDALPVVKLVVEHLFDSIDQSKIYAKRFAWVDRSEISIGAFVNSLKADVKVCPYALEDIGKNQILSCRAARIGEQSLAKTNSGMH